MNPKNLIFACALLYTSAVTASSLCSKESSETAPTASTSASGSESAPVKATFEPPLRRLMRRIVAARKEKRIEGLQPPTAIRLPHPEDSVNLVDIFENISPAAARVEHENFMQMLRNSLYGTSVSWAYHLALVGRLNEVKAAGLAEHLKSVLRQHQEKAFHALLSFNDKMKYASILYKRIEEGRSIDTGAYEAEWNALQYYANQLTEAYATNSKIAVILDRLDRD